ncbi:MAG: 4-hydroxythreonine-4-phosphate dehydrogenase PdxA [Clostridiaceae bacterium]|nr:4-hydroxythreonine-4-phosphate dehydrogenase PdxA [Clostridiaceae bacterium]
MRPLIGITLGDPAGIGPEITVKALADRTLSRRCRPLVIGDAWVLKNAASIVGRPDIRIHAIDKPSEGEYCPGCIDVIDMKAVKPDSFLVGKVSATAGEAAFQYVKKVIDLAMADEVDATVTNALNKEALNLAGRHYSGHTEIYAEFTGTEKYTMMLAHKNLRVVHVSTHVSLREACGRVKKARILEVIKIADRACNDMGIASPKIGVAGLNPHCGENGLFGREEIEEIIPAVEEAAAEGLDVSGPIPADTIFSKARGGWYDVVVAMYHDQGHIPLKVIGFVYDQEQGKWDAVEGVNITLGLPIIRTSVDHGTAFDQAGSGTANELSLLNAIDYAVRFANGRIKDKETKTIKNAETIWRRN